MHYLPKWQRVSLILGVAFFTLGVMLMLVAFAAPLGLHDLLRSSVKRAIVVDNTKAQMYKEWQDEGGPGQPKQWYYIYMFNITNAQDYLEGKAKPAVEQVGPYVYEDYKFRVNISFEDDALFRKFKLWEYWVYRPDLSAPLDAYTDQFVTVNVPMLAVLAKLSGTWYEYVGFDVLASMTASDLFTVKTVDELMWGYNDSLLELVDQLEPGAVPSSKFAYQMPGNASTPEEANQLYNFSVEYTGKNDTNQAWQIYEFDGMHTLDVWGSDFANALNGSIGEHFRPFLTKETLTNQSVYVSQLHRLVQMYSNSTVHLKGIEMLRAIVQPYNTLNCSSYAPNCDFYQYGPNGLFNISAPNFGAPLFLSAPHFTFCDPYLLSLVDGLTPNESLYQTFVDVEPITGTAMRARQSLMVSAHVQPIPLLYPFISEAWIPTLWGEQAGELNDAAAKQWKESVGIALALEKYLFIVALALGGGITLLASLHLVVIFVIIWRQISDESTRGDYEQLPEERVESEARVSINDKGGQKSIFDD